MCVCVERERERGRGREREGGGGRKSNIRKKSKEINESNFSYY